MKVWNIFCDTAQVDCGRGRKGGNRCSKLSEGDLELIEILKTGKGSIQLREIYSILEEVGDIESISLSSISRAVKFMRDVDIYLWYLYRLTRVNCILYILLICDRHKRTLVVSILYSKRFCCFIKCP